jgi:hypothetical protein
LLVNSYDIGINLMNAYPKMLEMANKHMFTVACIIGVIGATSQLMKIPNAQQQECSTLSTERVCTERKPKIYEKQSAQYVDMRRCSMTDNVLGLACCDQNCGGEEFNDNIFLERLNEPGVYRTKTVYCSRDDIDNAIPFLSECAFKDEGRNHIDVWKRDPYARKVVTNTENVLTCKPSASFHSYPGKILPETQNCKVDCEYSAKQTCEMKVGVQKAMIAALIPFTILSAAYLLKKFTTKHANEHDEEDEFFPRLERGEAIIYENGLMNPQRIALTELMNENPFSLLNEMTNESQDE